MKSYLLKWFLFSIALIALTEITNELLNIKMLLYNSFSEQLTKKQVQLILNIQNKWQWVTYFIAPFLLLIKTSLIASVVYIGAFFSKSLNVSFKQIWGAVLNAEFIFLLVPVSKIIWFRFCQTYFTLEDIQKFYPFSAINIIDYKGLEPWLIYPLQTLNLFEIAYIICLSYQIGSLTKTNADTGLKIVASSYIPALLLWVTIIMFFTLNFS